MRLARLNTRFSGWPVLSQLSAACHASLAPTSVTTDASSPAAQNSGLVATVFGCSGFLARYVVNSLARQGSQVPAALAFTAAPVMRDLSRMNISIRLSALLAALQCRVRRARPDSPVGVPYRKKSQ